MKANTPIYRNPNGDEVCRSYKAIIAKRDASGHITLDRKYWNYSATTGRHRNVFLGEGIADTRKKIANGTYSMDYLT
jgi:hypothetical protein